MLTTMLGPLEAILFAAGSNGLGLDEIASILQLSADEAKSLLLMLQEEYELRPRGLSLVELADSWQIVTRMEHAEYLRRMATRPMSATLSSAALEVLAVVSYHQPVTRADIESIRGVQSDRAISTLVQRHLISEVGRQDGPGRPILFGTTDTFLQVFGLKNLADLPPLPEAEDLPVDLSLFALTPSIPRD